MNTTPPAPIDLGAVEAAYPRVLHDGLRSLFDDPVRAPKIVLFDQYGVLHDGYRPMDGINDVLKHIKDRGVGLGLVSNSSATASRTIQESRLLGVDSQMFDVCVTSGDVARSVGSGVYFVLDECPWGLSPGGITSEIDLADTVVTQSRHPPNVEQERLLRQALLAGADLLWTGSAGTVYGQDDPTASHQRSPCLLPSPIACHYARIGGRVRAPAKPFADIFLAALAGCSFVEGSICDVLMIGDTFATDILGASVLGMQTLWVGPQAVDHARSPPKTTDAAWGHLWQDNGNALTHGCAVSAMW